MDSRYGSVIIKSVDFVRDGIAGAEANCGVAAVTTIGGGSD